MIPCYIILKNLQAFVFFHNFSKYFLIAFEKKEKVIVSGGAYCL